MWIYENDFKMYSRTVIFVQVSLNKVKEADHITSLSKKFIHSDMLFVIAKFKTQFQNDCKQQLSWKHNANSHVPYFLFVVWFKIV